jgi:host factor-I protein
MQVALKRRIVLLRSDLVSRTYDRGITWAGDDPFRVDAVAIPARAGFVRLPAMVRLVEWRRPAGAPRPARGPATSPSQKDHAVANEKAQNVQDVFLNHVRKNKTPVTVFLVNGVKLQGIITWFDNFSVLLRRDGHTQLVYKHAISTVMPGAPIQLFDASRTETGAAPSAPREMTADAEA